VRVVAKKTLRTFWELHSDSKGYLTSWYDEAIHSDWKSPADIKKAYSSVSFISNNRVVFNIKGNAYRLIIKINYGYRIVWIRFVGTHAEYDKINAENI
jgi:mRNA interferase HigB